MKYLDIKRLWLFLVLACCPGVDRALAQGTAFTYQGLLNTPAIPASGSYALQFTLYSASTGGTVLGGPVTNSAVAFTNGFFSTLVNFGPGAFTGTSNWLDIAVQTNTGTAFLALPPRQQVTPVPYAVYAASAGNISGSLGLAQLPAGVLTNNQTGVTLNGTFTGTNIFNSRVGIGTASPNFFTDVRGPATAWNNESSYLLSVGVQGINKQILLGYDTNVDYGVIQATWSGAAWKGLLLAPSGGNVGIGTTTPTTELQVNGTATATAFAGNGSALTSLNPANLAAGTAAINISGNAATATTAGSVSSVAAANVTGTLSTSQLPAGLIVNNQSTEFALNSDLRMNNNPIYLGGDQNHGLEFTSSFGGGNVNGPALFGFGGGVLGTMAGGQLGVLYWSYPGLVGIGKANPATALDVNGTVTATAFTGNGAGLTNLNLPSYAIVNGQSTEFDLNNSLVMGNNPIYLKDQNQGLEYASSFGGGNVNGPALFGFGGGVLGTMAGGQLGVLYWSYPGLVGIDKTNPATALDVNGTVNATAFTGNGSGLTNVAYASLVGAPAIPSTNGFVTKAITNGLASTNFVLTQLAGVSVGNSGLASNVVAGI